MPTTTDSPVKGFAAGFPVADNSKLISHLQTSNSSVQAYLLVCCSVAAMVEVGEGGVKAEQRLLALTAAQVHALKLPGSDCSLRRVPSTT